MTNVIFPPRRLGSSEDWGRDVEGRINKISRALTLTRQTLENLERQSVSQGGLVVNQIQKLWNTSLSLQGQNEVLGERLSTLQGETYVNVNSFGPQETLTKPEWASAAVVIAGMEAVSNPGTGWAARIDVYAETHSISSGDITGNRAVAQGAMGWEPGTPGTAPDFLSFESLPRVRFFGGDEGDDTLYLRPYGVQVGGGSTSVTHTFNLTTTVFWV